jgi:hypothetical protein
LLRVLFVFFESQIGISAGSGPGKNRLKNLSTATIKIGVKQHSAMHDIGGGSNRAPQTTGATTTKSTTFLNILISSSSMWLPTFLHYKKLLHHYVFFEILVLKLMAKKLEKIERKRNAFFRINGTS